MVTESYVDDVMDAVSTHAPPHHEAAFWGWLGNVKFAEHGNLTLELAREILSNVPVLYREFLEELEGEGDEQPD